MDGLSILFGILTVLFLAVVLGMNILGTTAGSFIELDQENFVDTPPSLGVKIKKVLDPLALYTNPEGKAISEGNDLCTLFTQVRKSIAQNLQGDLSDSETFKKVEAQLAIDIPGGALPCPLLNYPSDSATDLEWLTWLQTVPLDFGARVVFMANYADSKLTSVADSLKNALSGTIELPPLPKEGFSPSVCTPMLAEKKRIDQESASCVDPKTLSSAQIEEEAMKLLEAIVAEKTKALAALPLKDRTAVLKTPNDSIKSAKQAADYLNEQKQKVEAGTLTPTGTNPKLS